MKTFYYTEEELKNLTLYHSESEVNIYQKDNLLLKIYNDFNENLIAKIFFFSKCNFNYVSSPIGFIKINNRYYGHVIKINNNFTSIINYKDLSLDKKYQLLIKLKYHLEELHQMGIIYGNLNPNNIMTDGKDIILTDIVNSKFDNHDFSIYSKNMLKYLKENSVIDEKIDNYMLNLFTIYFLNDIEYDNIFDEIINNIDDYFNNKDAKEIIGITDNFRCITITNKLYKPDNNINELLIDHIDIKKYNEKVKTLTKQ